MVSSPILCLGAGSALGSQALLFTGFSALFPINSAVIDALAEVENMPARFLEARVRRPKLLRLAALESATETREIAKKTPEKNI
jgi:hypothetical protein